MYPSLSFTSICCFAVQQLFGFLHLKSIYTDVAHALVCNFRLGNISSACKCVSLALESRLCQVDRDNGSELTRECVMQDGEHVNIPTKAASITVLVFTWWEMSLESSSPFSFERKDVWLWSHQPWTSEAVEKHPSSWVLGVPLIGDHVFVPDRLWNGVLLHGCVTPAPHQGDWLVWSCGMFPSAPQ